MYDKITWDYDILLGIRLHQCRHCADMCAIKLKGGNSLNPIFVADLFK